MEFSKATFLKYLLTAGKLFLLQLGRVDIFTDILSQKLRVRVVK